MSSLLPTTADLVSPSRRRSGSFESSATLSTASQSNNVEPDQISSDARVKERKPELDRTPSTPPEKKWRALFPAIPKIAALLTVVFFSVSLWLFGSLENSANQAHNLNVLVVDFDGGAIGSSLLAAVSSLNGTPTLPTFFVVPAAGLTPEEINKRVFDGKAWGAIYSTSGASDRFNEAMVLGAEPSYVATDVLVLTGVQTRYATVWASILLPALNQAEEVASEIFFQSTITPLIISTINGTSHTLSSSQISLLSNPIGSTFVDPAPFEFASRVLVNTVGMVLEGLMQFFFIMGLNGTMAGLGYYRRASIGSLLKFRYPLKFAWTILCGIISLLWILPVSEHTLGAKQVFALWTVNWSYAFIFFNTFDTLTSFIPMPFIPPCVITVLLTSVAAAIYPIELQHPFYKIHYMFPSHANWMVQIVIYGHGAVRSNLKYIGVLAAWIVVTEITSLLGQRNRSRASMKEEEKEAASAAAP